MKKLQILITGINGLLGSTLAIVLKKDGHQIYNLPIDITDPKEIKKWSIANSSFDWIIHTAAITNVGYCEENQRKCYATNVLGTKYIRDLAQKTGARLIHISTTSVFSGDKGGYKETDVPYPKNFYNLSKLMAEQIVSEYDKGLILRINLIGIHPLKGSRGLNFFEWLVSSIQSDQNINLFSDILLNPLSNWTLSELIAKIIKIKPKIKILHLGSKNTLSKADIGKIVIKHFKKYTGQTNIVTSDSINKKLSGPKQMWINTDYAIKKLRLKMPIIESEIKKIFKNYNAYVTNKNR